MSKPPCMVIVKNILPALRAKIAKELIENYGLKRKDVAKLLGLTQSAVSQYMSSKRGLTGIQMIERSERASEVINELIEKLIKGEFSIDDEVDYICRICEILRDEDIV
ncbi:putative transcriptional regulator [Archaeoglobus sulfaticallidus PM70-1]|uniref:Putative transcriptional regulator n=1 Tax=Archaeoglobus sulfaticallidus PM70-1 TaxID=387631 RepID=N0BEK2_9EURY|nr:helix-turn-helix domain-containing protein [Archaeoglobus sulfaticallidus]AGK60702.1 putative transcriptional regulator [Archaeoglobus sulfaticallidus PM70-1]